MWISRASVAFELSDDCNTEYITAWMDVYLPSMSPFSGAAKYSFRLPAHYGMRYALDPQ